MSTTTQTTTEQLLHAPPGITQVTTGRPKKTKAFHHVNSKLTKNSRKVKVGTFSEGGSGRKASDVEPCSKPSVDAEPPLKRSNASSFTESTGLTLKGLKITSLKRAGEYRLGPKQGSSPVKCIEQYLARKDGTDEFYVIKILTRKNQGEKETTDDIQGKTLLHTEHSLLSLVQNEPGVIHEHGLFNETIQEPFVNEKGEVTTKEVRRVCLVLDCYTTHDFSPKYSNITNMQIHVMKEKKLPEADAILIFYKVVQIVERLHKLNIVHRDLKLGNIILNRETKEVTLANFCLGKHLSRDDEPFKDQRGSPAYISPDVINGKPYLGKPSDMWALGVVLYTMLYGQFPFYDQNPTELFRKIKLGEFNIPVDVNVSTKTVELIKSLLNLDPKKRLTASATLDKVRSIIAEEQAFLSDSDLQVVPDCPPGVDRPKKRSYNDRCVCSPTENTLALAAGIAAFLVGSELESPTSEPDDWEPMCKKSNLTNSKVPLHGLGTMNRDHWERLQTLFTASKQRNQSAGLCLDDVSAQLSPTSSNGFTKCATNNDCARVPDSDFSSADVMIPTSKRSRSSGLESKQALLDIEGVAPKQRYNNNSFPVTQCSYHAQV